VVGSSSRFPDSLLPKRSDSRLPNPQTVEPFTRIPYETYRARCERCVASPPPLLTTEYQQQIYQLIPRRLLGPSLHICVAACCGEQDAALQSYPDLERASWPLGGATLLVEFSLPERRGCREVSPTTLPKAQRADHSKINSLDSGCSLVRSTAGAVVSMNCLSMLSTSSCESAISRSARWGSSVSQ
jgi:hypothetical protein